MAEEDRTLHAAQPVDAADGEVGGEATEPASRLMRQLDQQSRIADQLQHFTERAETALAAGDLTAMDRALASRGKLLDAAMRQQMAIQESVRASQPLGLRGAELLSQLNQRLNQLGRRNALLIESAHAHRMKLHGQRRRIAAGSQLASAYNRPAASNAPASRGGITA